MFRQGAPTILSPAVNNISWLGQPAVHDRLTKTSFFLGALLLPGSCGGAAPFYEEFTVWGSTHHVYGFAVAKSGTILAFSEGRRDTGDAAPKDLLLKRSTDGGRTWSADVLIEKMSGAYWSKHGRPGVKESWTNPAPVVDNITGKVFFFYALNDFDQDPRRQRMTRVFCRFSADDGSSWSDRFEITDILNVRRDGSPNQDANGAWILNADGFPSDYLGRAFHMPGPGHGIQASDGRLILQIWNRRSVGNSIENRVYGVTLIYSDDHGETWKFGGFVDEGKTGMNESRLVELEDGRFYVNARWATGGMAHRVVATSLDETLDEWTKPTSETELPKSVTLDAGLVRLTHSETGDRSRILWPKANDTTLEPDEHPYNARNSMTVFLSYDEAQTWPVRKLVDPGWGNYSDLAVLEDKAILLLWGAGASSEEQKVVCSRFNLEWLTDGADSLEVGAR